MASDNIFSGLKVVELASFIAGPSAAVILSDFGADVIKVEPPSGDTWRVGHKIRRSRKPAMLIRGTWPTATSGESRSI
jgi:crotonobetainyl-CoA:carnitine CoA-transferase CaiB-like acyl-CoA transferase